MRISALLSRYLNSRLKFGMYLLFFFSNSGNGQYHRVFESLFGRQHLCRDHSICDDPISCRLYKCQKVCWSLKMTSLGSRSSVVEEDINRSRALFRLYTQCKDGIEATLWLRVLRTTRSLWPWWRSLNWKVFLDAASAHADDDCIEMKSKYSVISSVHLYSIQSNASSLNKDNVCAEELDWWMKYRFFRQLWKRIRNNSLKVMDSLCIWW